MSNRFSLIYCQRKLLLTWLIGSIPILLLMITRSLAGSFEGYEQEIWGWLVPLLFPTITLMLGAYSATALKELSSQKTVDKLFFIISIGFSVFYLVTLNGVVILQPFLDSTVFVSTQRASLLLGVIQGLTTTCLGVFFVSQG